MTNTHIGTEPALRGGPLHSTHARREAHRKTDGDVIAPMIVDPSPDVPNRGRLDPCPAPRPSPASAISTVRSTQTSAPRGGPRSRPHWAREESEHLRTRYVGAPGREGWSRRRTNLAVMIGPPQAVSGFTMPDGATAWLSGRCQRHRAPDLVFARSLTHVTPE